MSRAVLARVAFLTVLFALSWVPVSKSAETDSADAQDAEVGSLVEQIIENGSREATEKLVKLGQPAVAPLAEAAETDNAAVVTRCFDVLGRLLASDDEPTAKAAQESLEELSKSDIDIVGRRARTTLRLKDLLRKREALLKDGPIGQGVRYKSTKNGRTIHLARAADGSFTGKIKETVDGKEKETEIKVATENELEEKFPDAHELVQRQQQRQQQLGGFPAPNPRIPPGLRPPGIQINGNFFGGPAGLSIKISEVNNKRRIEVGNGDEKIEITDAAGKDIELKHTRTVDGKAKTDEYKAVDLDDLKKKHPEAAKLYEKYGVANNVMIGGAGGGVQLQIRAAPGGGFQVPVPGFQAESISNQSATPRIIRAEQEGRKIEITDEDGMKIRVKLTKDVDGKAVSQEFSADDLKSLKSEHPEAAKLYEQLTGRKSE